MTVQKSLYYIALVTLTLTACKTTQPSQTTTTTPVKPAIDCGTEAPVYTVDIKPVLDQHCNSCHGQRKAAGYNFQTMEDITRAAKNGTLVGSIKWGQGFAHMPARADKLDDATIKKIECWINSGMK